VVAHTFTKQTKKFKKLSSRNLMPSVFWDRSADGGIHATRDHNNVTNVLQNTKKWHRAIQNKRHGMLTPGVVLLHDNVRPRRAAHTRALLEHFKWELSDHPPYSPAFAPSDLAPVYLPEELTENQCFNSNDELMEGVETWLSSQAADFFETGIQKLFPIMTNASSSVVSMLRSNLSMYIFFVYVFSLTACFVNSSLKLEVTFRIAVVYV
jgi:hypothetical protein